MEANKRFVVYLVLTVLFCEGCRVTPPTFEPIALLKPNGYDCFSTPNLSISDSTLHLLYTGLQGDTTALFYSKGDDGAPLEVARGDDWFVNWADFSDIAGSGEALLTHWLQKSASGTYDYDIKISKSDDAGQTWSAPMTLHGDKIAAEHGFVSFADYNADLFYASWLDGRNTKTKDDRDTTKHLPMTLRGGLIDKETLVIEEKELDRKVCDCCQTASVKTTYGMLTAYRDRSDDEIRDINLVHFDTQEVIYQSNDQWKINGCPVNGPALASYDDQVALAYYTAADGPSSWLVLSSDQFNTHQKIQIDNGNPLGRVDVEMTEEKTYVTWMEIEEKTAAIRMKIIQNSDGQIINDLLVATVTNSRRTGFPRLKILNNSAYIAYTIVLDADRTDIRLSKLDL